MGPPAPPQSRRPFHARQVMILLTGPQYIQAAENPNRVKKAEPILYELSVSAASSLDQLTLITLVPYGQVKVPTGFYFIKANSADSRHEGPARHRKKAH